MSGVSSSRNEGRERDRGRKGREREIFSNGSLPNACNDDRNTKLILVSYLIDRDRLP